MWIQRSWIERPFSLRGIRIGRPTKRGGGKILEKIFNLLKEKGRKEEEENKIYIISSAYIVMSTTTVFELYDNVFLLNSESKITTTED